jgi:hypothetical protein
MESRLLGVLAVVLLVLVLLLAALVSPGAALVVGGALAVSEGHPFDGGPATLAGLLNQSAIPDPAAAMIKQPIENGDFAVIGGAPKGGAKTAWWKHKTWGDLARDQEAVAEYLRVRRAAINNPNFDWGPVLKKVKPLLAQNREWIGLVNVEADGVTLRLDAHEPSPVKVGSHRKSKTAGDVLASVPAYLVSKYSEMPALFIFHTHPDDPRGEPRPSTVDIVGSILTSINSWFAAEVVISSYGVFMYGMTGPSYARIQEAKNPRLAMYHYMYDVAAALESRRSWAPHHWTDYLESFPRYGLFMHVVPSAKLVGHSSHTTSYHSNILRNSDFELLESYRGRILDAHKDADREARKAKPEAEDTAEPKSE